MKITARVMGGDTYELELEDATSADVLRAVGLRPQEATVVVDGRPVPEDQPLEQEEVNVLRLISGGVTGLPARPVAMPSRDPPSA